MLNNLFFKQKLYTNIVFILGALNITGYFYGDSYICLFAGIIILGLWFDMLD